MDVFQLYKPFRNKVALLSCHDALNVIWAYSQFLQIDDFQIPKEIEVNRQFLDQKVPKIMIPEWELETLAKEMLLNAGIAATKHRTLRSWDTLAKLIDQLRDLENNIYGLYGSSNNILLDLMRIAHRQFIWQSNPPNSAATIRYFKIFNCPNINEICLDRLGLSVLEIYLCGMALFGLLFHHPMVKIPISSDIETLSADTFEKFLKFTCRKQSEIKRLLKSEQRYDSRFSYAYNSLRAFPLIRLEPLNKSVIACPLPTMLYWRITAGLYYELVSDKRFSQPFGDSFQRYVGDVIERACTGGKLNYFGEHEYGVKKSRKNSVDWIVSGSSSALFIECKTKRLSWDAKTDVEDLRSLEADINDLADGFVQLYKTSLDYIDGQYPHFKFVEGRKIFPALVTLENWHFFGPAMLDRLQDAIVAKLKIAKLPDNLVHEMPYSVWPIEDLEVGLQVMNKRGIQDFMDGKVNDPEMVRWGWQSYTRHNFPEDLPAKMLFADDYESMFSQVLS